MGYMGHWPILRAHHHFGQGLSLFLFTKLYLFLWVILVWVCEPVFSDQPQSESYTKISFVYLISQKVDPFINSPPPLPKVNFIKSLIAELTFYLGVQNLENGSQYTPYFRVSGNFTIKYEIKIQFIDKSIPL